MKRVIFLCSHVYSGSGALYEAMNRHPRIQGYRPLGGEAVYVDSSSLLALTNQPHKLPNRAAIYMDELLVNTNFYVKSAYEKCKFAYLIRDPLPILGQLVANDRKQPSFALRIYATRLRRLYEMSRRTPGAVLLTWEDLRQARLSFIEEYLELREPIPFDSTSLSAYQQNRNENLPVSIRSEAENIYEKYLYLMRNQDLRYWS